MLEHEDLEKLISNLFSRWDLTQEQQAVLKIQGADGWLLAIHKSLRLLFPQNERICYSWVKMRNGDFDNQRPLEVMMREGIAGMMRVSQYLDEERGI
jgi:hypothetical protein